ncbi:hypothetical protein EV175_003240 [Coemansia sp. RSA 1933]|nr:hypothetical protein EV175_003240 [Coemansia sp. RSA 1933]
MNKVHRPTFIGIHSRDASTQVLYISSGCRQSTGFTPEQLMSKSAHDFIADPYKDDYLTIFENKDDDGEGNVEDDEANAFVMYINVKNTSGTPVLHRITTFKCDNCIIVIGVGFPEIPYQGKHELEVQMLDGAMKRKNVTRDREEERRNAGNHKSAAARWRQRAETPYGGRVPLYYAKSKQVKAAFVLENPAANERARRQNGPLVVFVIGSVGRLIDADTADLMRSPFLMLVAPEDLLKVSTFFDKLSDNPDVLFETFSLLERPPVIEGDIVVPDRQNKRVVVECLGANVQDGMAMLLRRIRVEAPPTMDDMGNYLRPKMREDEQYSGYMTLSEMISDDPETSDAAEWSQLL